MLVSELQRSKHFLSYLVFKSLLELQSTTLLLFYCVIVVSISWSNCDFLKQIDEATVSTKKRTEVIFTGRNEVVAKVIFLHLSVIHSVHRREGVCLCACWDTTPLDYVPPRLCTPRTTYPRTTYPRTTYPQTTYPPDYPLLDYVSPLDYVPPRLHIPPNYIPPRTTYPPPEADSSIRSTSGRYASYWNAFLSKGALCN